MNRIIESEGDFQLRQAQRRYVPIASTIAACLFALLPIVATVPLLPDLAFLTLIAWRLMRPEMWTPRAALAIGLLNDIVAGHPIGQSMALWTIAFLILDLVDSRTVYRDFWLDWLLAGLLIAFYTIGDWYIGQWMGSSASLSVMTPQILIAVLAFPAVARIVAALDRWRLAR